MGGIMSSRFGNYEEIDGLRLSIEKSKAFHRKDRKGREEGLLQIERPRVSSGGLVFSIVLLTHVGGDSSFAGLF